MIRTSQPTPGFHRARRAALRALAGLTVLLLTGCDEIIGGLTNSYTGPPPETKDIVGETAIVRSVSRHSETGILFFYLDRTRYMESEPGSMNRVIRVTAEEVQRVAESLNLKVGDRVKISTRFGHIEDMAGMGAFVPNWPYGNYFEHPIAFHRLTALERAGP